MCQAILKISLEPLQLALLRESCGIFCLFLFDWLSVLLWVFKLWCEGSGDTVNVPQAHQSIYSTYRTYFVAHPHLWDAMHTIVPKICHEDTLNLSQNTSQYLYHVGLLIHPCVFRTLATQTCQSIPEHLLAHSVCGWRKKREKYISFIKGNNAM